MNTDTSNDSVSSIFLKNINIKAEKNFISIQHFFIWVKKLCAREKK